MRRDDTDIFADKNEGKVLIMANPFAQPNASHLLNLIATSLRGGTQYLKAEHKRGKEPDELVTARIEVGDQMELLF